MEETKARITEVSRICGKCWEEDGIAIPIYEFEEFEGDTIIRVHNHKDMKIKKEILEALEDE